MVAHANVVYAEGQGYGQTERTNGADKSERNVVGNRTAIHIGNKRIAANPDNERTGKLQDASRTQGTHGSDELFRKQYPIPNWDNFPTQSPVCGRNDGISDRLADLSFSKWRNESISALGNAIVPQVAYQIFKAIESVKP
jgi:hypothetical protein